MADRKPKSTTPAAKPKRAPALERKTLVRVSYQGEPGAYSEDAVRAAFPDAEPLPRERVRDAFAAVEARASGRDASLARRPRSARLWSLVATPSIYRCR